MGARYDPRFVRHGGNRGASLVGRSDSGLFDGHPDQSSIYVVVESAAVFAATTVVMLVLYVRNSPASLAGLDVASQLAVCVHSSFLFFAH